MRILVLEDCTLLNECIVKLLRLSGHEVTGVIDVYQAFDHIREHKTDLILMSPVMGERSICQIIRLVRTSSPGIKIIVMHTSTAISDKVEMMGCDGFFAKDGTSFNKIHELLEKVSA